MNCCTIETNKKLCHKVAPSIVHVLKMFFKMLNMCALQLLSLAQVLLRGWGGGVGVGGS